MKKNQELCEAVARGNQTKVKQLLDAGADINGVDTAASRTPLTTAIERGRTELAKLLLELGADPSARPKNNWKPESPLHLAAQRGNLEVVRELLARGVKVNAVIKPHNGSAGCTPLMYAAEGGNLEVVRFLIENGANVAARDERGSTAVTFADKKEVKAYLSDLLKQQPTVTKPGELAAAVRDGLTERAIALLDGGMSADDVDSQGQTALIIAVEKNDLELTRLLLDRGANVNAPTKNGWLPITSFGIKPKMIALLIQRGADPNAKMSDGDTALHWAFGSGSKQLVQAMLAAGGKLQIDDEEKKELLEQARSMNRSVLPLLRDHLGEAANEVDNIRAHVKEFVKLSEAAAFQDVAQRIGELVGRKPGPWKRRKGVVYFHGVSVTKHLASYYKEPAGDTANLDRTWQLFARYSREILDEGYTLILHDSLGEAGRFPLLLFPTADKFAVLAAVGTNGVNYGHDTDAVIRWLLDLEKTCPFHLVDAGHDFVGGHFTSTIRDPRALVERMLKFCPDIRNFADADVKPWTEEEVVAELVKDVQANRSFAFWWD